MARAYKNPLKKRLGEEFFAEIPKSPGVYFMRCGKGRILYVGKATSLRARLRSYCNAKPGKVGGNIIRLIELVERIHWELHDSEQKAWERELQLIRALVPPYNIADKWRESYFFIGLRGPRSGRIDFRLTSRDRDVDEAFDLHGCYPLRRQVKNGYASLLRLLYACSQKTGRFSFPAKLARPSPCYNYSLKIEHARRWRGLLSSFLHGDSTPLLRAIVEGLLANANIPAYARPALQRDLEAVKAFEDACVDARRLRAAEEGERGFVTHRQLRRRIRDSVTPVDEPELQDSI